MLLTWLNLRHPGMMGRYIKGSCTRVKVFYLISRLGGSWQRNFQQRIERFVTFGIKACFSFKTKMASLKMNVSVTPKMKNTLENSITIQNRILEMEELKKAKEHNEVKLAILEANIVKEPMKCKHVCAKLRKLSQQSSIDSYANEF